MRPLFLTILCILTFIGSGMGIYQSIINYTNADMAVAVSKDAMDEAEDKIATEAESEEQAALAEKILGSVASGLTAENIRNNSIATGISSVLTLLGAILMWGLQKRGFWIYVAGTAIGIIAPLIVYGGFVGAMAGSVLAFMGILFCILYGLNLKHMH